MNFAGARRLCDLIIPVLIIERVERFFELSHLLMHPLAQAARYEFAGFIPYLRVAL